MCGIVGVWNRDGQVPDESVLRAMMDRISTRGPDDSGVWRGQGMGLGHLRLSILDLSSRGHQPFVSRDGVGVLSYNGEVYNFRELRSELEAEGCEFISTTDTEVVLYALQRWGVRRAVEKFNGMFAFAYFDVEKRSLWLARDRLGIKPLYTYQSGKDLIFASEIKALLAHPLVRCEPNRSELTSYVFYGKFERACVPFSGVEAVVPGCVWHIDERGSSKEVYFDVTERVDVNRIDDGESLDDVVDRAAVALTESVRMHLVSDAPLAVMCSGGVDSSLITALARTEKPDVVAYVAHVENIDEELHRATRVARHLNVPLKTVKISFADYATAWPLALWHTEHPAVLVNDPPFMALLNAMRADGVKVALSGEGADELFGGYSWQRGSQRKWWLLNAIQRVTGQGRFAKWLSDKAAQTDVFRNEIHHRRPFWRLDGGQAANTAFLATIDGGKRLCRQQQLFRLLSKGRHPGDAALIARCLDDLHGHLQGLLDRNDRLGMAASIETRVPFIENRLMDMAMHLSAGNRYDDGGKPVLKRVAGRYLPQDIVYAKKIGFAVPSAMWNSAEGLLENGVVKDIFEWSAPCCGMILDEIRSQPDLLLAFIGIEIWGRIFFQGEDPCLLGEKLCDLQREGR